eukprot:Opistho-1_new@47459
MPLAPRKVDFNQRWTELRGNVEQVLLCNGVNKQSWMMMYETVYALCIAVPNPYAERLYEHLESFLRTHVVNQKMLILERQADLLEAYHSAWRDFYLGAQGIDTVFGYLNKTIVKPNEEGAEKFGAHGKGPKTVLSLALSSWKELVYNHLKDKLLYHILREVARDRDGVGGINLRVVKDDIQSYLDLNSDSKRPLDLFVSDMETPFLSATAEYYKREASALSASSDVSTYMRRVEERLEEEEIRSRQLLPAASHPKVIHIFLNEMVAGQKTRLNADFETFIADQRLEDLARMYNLLRRVVNGLDLMLEIFQRHIATMGLSALRCLGDNITDPTQYVDTLLKIHEKYLNLVKTAFASDATFVGALDKGCRTIVNDTTQLRASVSPPELLARYCDLLLKKSNHKAMSDADLDAKLLSVLLVFKYVDDKDVFQKFYSKMLAKRLIHGTSMSNESERAMISHLKSACGYEYTGKLHRMFQDIEVSQGQNANFRDYCERHSWNLGLDFHIFVLQAGAWPMGQMHTTFSIPQELERCVEKFESFYNATYNGRKLSWLHALGKGEVKAEFGGRRYDFSVTTFQMGILLLFNASPTVTLADMESSTALRDAELRRNVKPLVDVGILTVNAQSDEWSADASFTVNEGFTSKRTKIKVSTAVQAETQGETESTRRSVDEDRKIYVQAAVVRVMKSRKVLAHTQLMDEVIKQCAARFAPPIPLIKKCIEILIEKQFLERVEGTRDKYSYIA